MEEQDLEPTKRIMSADPHRVETILAEAAACNRLIPFAAKFA